MDAFLENLTSCKNRTLEITGLMVESTTGADPLKPMSLCNQSANQSKNKHLGKMTCTAQASSAAMAAAASGDIKPAQDSRAGRLAGRHSEGGS